jgi:hypothetical protein
MSIGQLRDQYIILFGQEPAKDGVLDQIERELDVVLPTDFREICSFYSGGIVGGISHYARIVMMFHDWMTWHHFIPPSFGIRTPIFSNSC